MNKKRDLLSDILTWFLIVICVFSLWACGFLIGQKTRENVSNISNIALVENRANDIDTNYDTPTQTFINGGFTEKVYQPQSRENLYFLQTSVNSSVDIGYDYIYGFTINVDIWLSSVLRYDTESIFEPSFNDASKQSFDIPIDLEIDLDTFTSIELVFYISDYATDEFEFTCEVYINGNSYDYIYLYYVPSFSITTITKSFNFLTNVILIDSEIIEQYSLAFDDGYADGKEVGYDEGYYDRDAEYEDTDGAFTMIWQFISNAFASVFNVLDIHLFAGIKLFHILAIPLIISVLYFVIKILAK